MSRDRVVLDGLHTDEDWPVELAESLIADQTPWGLGIGESGHSQSMKFYRLARCVNAHNRHHGGYEWAHLALEAIESHSSEAYSTQDLLDIVCLVCRADHFRNGTVRTEEPRLRLVLQEVVQRVHSDAPPIFVKRVQ
jgi:hypothetical protein